MSGFLRALTAHARERPDQVALVGPDATLSYARLHRDSAAVAAGLAAAGVRPGDVVAVHAEKTAAVIAGLVGIVRAGAAYVPIDPTAPAAHRIGLLEDCAARAILCTAGRADTLRRQGVTVVTVEDLVASGSPAVAVHEDPDRIAYMIYTSGSTGRPKGVRIPHRALDAFVAAVVPSLGFDAAARCLNTLPLHFDGSVVDLLVPLAVGARLNLGPAVMAPSLVLDLVEGERITHMTAIGSTLALLAQRGDLAARDLTALRMVLTGAEIVHPGAVQAWLAAAPNLTVFNGYGPTETTVIVTAQRISEREPGRTAPYPIGPELPGSHICFLDADGTCSADGPGELLIAGDQLMAGYHQRPEEERRAFLEVHGVRHYRSGDIGSRGPDGAIRFDGRRDDEVKIRGNRINLNEVKRGVERHPAVGQAFVEAVPDGADGLRLACAVTVPAGAGDDLPRQLEAHCAAVLPRSMAPRSYHVLAALPTLPSGKPDRARIRALLTEPQPHGRVDRQEPAGQR
ncbi:amino acid adenylation domain-containing protein [Dactylosporangium aurantiacum]|uniref:Amino acid adenylation domain-containing protein n=1 Tax=Dactylosporangium aurantiacum TaxID=35754 RepID=A0A9Q9INH1_9ACTN|nr:amino acid adenylation domain-containing protein [Dactylosporangium aurantiacum]MDG6103899.1 amino acid adenylation domain-containing protein [Dactylosporangium aurantiacum]UWZ58911.1 amino acid adenylation domain-containing protein [Dactylosporangium aurantiacum]